MPQGQMPFAKGLLRRPATPPQKQADSGDNYILIPNVVSCKAGDNANGNITPEVIKQLAETYNTDYLRAPITPDHVQEGLAWGWIPQVRSQNDTLYTDFDVHALFYWVLEEGLMRRRSIEYWPKAQLANGSTGPLLKAVSVLGAATPAVKSMPDIPFNNGPESFEEQNALGVFRMLSSERFDFNQQATKDFGEWLTVDYEPEPQRPINVDTKTLGAASAQEQHKNERTEDTMPDTDTNKYAAFEAELAKNGTSLEKLAADYGTLKTSVGELSEKLASAETTNTQLSTQLTAANSAILTINKTSEDKEEKSRFSTAFSAAVLGGRLPKAVEAKLFAVYNKLPSESLAEAHCELAEGDKTRKASARSLLLEVFGELAKVIPVHPRGAATFDTQPVSGSNAAYTPGTKAFSDALNVRVAEMLSDKPDYTADQYEAALKQADAELRQRAATA